MVGKCVAVLDFVVRRQSAVKNCQSGTVRVRVSQSYGGEQFALNFAQNLNSQFCCMNVAPVYFFPSDAPTDRGAVIKREKKALVANPCS